MVPIADAIPVIEQPLTSVAAIRHRLSLRRDQLKPARARADASRKEYVTAANATRALRDRQADFEARLKVAKTELGALSARSLLSGSASDTRAETDLSVQIARLEGAIAWINDTAVPEALLLDNRANWTAHADEMEARHLEETVLRLENLLSTIEHYPADYLPPLLQPGNMRIME